MFQWVPAWVINNDGYNDLSQVYQTTAGFRVVQRLLLCLILSAIWPWTISPGACSLLIIVITPFVESCHHRYAVLARVHLQDARVSAVPRYSAILRACLRCLRCSLGWGACSVSLSSSRVRLPAALPPSTAHSARLGSLMSSGSRSLESGWPVWRLSHLHSRCLQL